VIWCVAVVSICLAQQNTYDPERRMFTVYSPAIELLPSEIHNKPTPVVPLPDQLVRDFADGAQMMITNYSFDVVYFQGTKEYQMPLYDVYNHHYILYMGSNESMAAIYDYMKGHNPVGGQPCWHEQHPEDDAESACRLDSMASASRCLAQVQKQDASTSAASFGGAAGGEMRNNPHVFPGPYGIPVPNPQALMPVLHFINTRNTTAHELLPDDLPLVSPFIQCPCTPERKFDYHNGTIDGCVPSPKFSCNEWFENSRNPGCKLETYTAGYRCCEDGVFLNGRSHDPQGLNGLPTSARTTAYAKMEFYFRRSPTVLDAGHSPALVQFTLDVTADNTAVEKSKRSVGNIEYTVPKCPAGTPPQQCIHEVSTVVKLFDVTKDMYEVDVVHIVGHVHSGAIRHQFINATSGQMICDAALTYGQSDQPGDERGYLVGIEPCVFDPPLKLDAASEVRMVTAYNNTEEIGGVMALWFLMATYTRT